MQYSVARIPKRFREALSDIQKGKMQNGGRGQDVDLAWLKRD